MLRLPALNFAGSGFLTDNHGAELGPAVTLEAFPVTHPFHQTGGRPGVETSNQRCSSG